MQMNLGQHVQLSRAFASRRAVGEGGVVCVMRGMWILKLSLMILFPYLSETVLPDYDHQSSAQDKKNIGIINCGRDEVRCHDGKQCVNRTVFCNGVNDCDDKSDEYLCVGIILQVNCSESEYRCTDNKGCHPRSTLCDHVHDCMDGADEIICDPIEKCEVEYNRFLCTNRQQCISTNKLCNHHPDCLDGSDESGHCDSAVGECSRGKCGTIGRCTPSPSGSKCVCPSGYRLTFNRSHCNDIDECKESLPCDHLCSNTQGSYNCSCRQGYSLVQGHRCLAKGQVPKLYVTVNSQMLEYNMRSSQWTLLVMDFQRITNIAYGPKDTLYWSELGDSGKALYSLHLDGTHQFLKQTVINTGLQYPEDLSVDWTTGHVYVSDSGRNHIICCTGTGNVCAVVLQNTPAVKSVVINQVKRKIYWSSLTQPAKIEQSDLDGGQRSDIINAGLVHPTGLFVDYVKERIYWADSVLGRIEYVGFDGNDVKMLISRDMGFPVSVAVFEDQVYWTDFKQQKVCACNRSNNCQHVKIIKENAGHPTGMAVGHPAAYMATNDNPCRYHRCSHLCLPSNSHYSYSCACPPDHTLMADRKTCTKLRNVTDLYIGGRGAILTLPLSSIGYFEDLVEVHYLNAIEHTPGCLAVDPHRDRVIYAREKAIVMVELGRTATEKVLFSRTLKRVSDLLVDWSTGNIYWADTIKGTIEMGRVIGGLHIILLNEVNGIKRPNSLDIDFKNGYVYFSDIERDGYIGFCLLSTTQCNQIQGFVGHANKVLLDHDENRLYIAYDDLYQIISLNVPEGSKRIVHWLGSTLKPFSLALFGDWIYFTPSPDSNADGVYFINKHRINSEGKILQRKGRLVGLACRDNIHGQQVTTLCSDNNGGCEEFCLPISQSTVQCRCRDDFILQKDNRTCKENKVGTETTLTETKDGVGTKLTGPTCAGHRCSDGQCIPAAYVCDDQPDCMDESDEKETLCRGRSKTAAQQVTTKTGITNCVPGVYKCDNGNCIPYSLVCDNSSNCPNATDEGKLCESACKIKNKCEHICLPTPRGSVCQCRHGYKLRLDGIKCYDIDECLVNNGNCSQICEDMRGGRKCHCAHGYRLSTKTDCVATQGPTPFFIVGGKMGIQMVNWTNHITQDSKIDQISGNIVALDVVMATQEVIFSSNMKPEIYMQRWNDSRTVTLVQNTQGSVHDIAYDWLGMNVYFTTGETLVVCNLNGVCKTLLYEDVRHICLCPKQRNMFFVKPLSNALYKMWMDGGGQQLFITNDHHRPVSLTIDHPAERLYWLEFRTNRVESCRMDGTDRQVVIQHLHLLYFTSIAVFENTLYLNDFKTSSIHTFHKGEPAKANGTIPLMSKTFIAKVVHPLLQVWSQNDCDKLKCSHLCLFGEKGGNCYCPDGYWFVNNLKQTCTNTSVLTTYSASIPSTATQDNLQQTQNDVVTQAISVGQSTRTQMVEVFNGEWSTRPHGMVTPVTDINPDGSSRTPDVETQASDIELDKTSSTQGVELSSNVSICGGIKCQNGGYCEKIDNSSVCRCRLGFHGSFCEKSVMQSSGNHSLVVGMFLGLICCILGVVICILCLTPKRYSDRLQRCRLYLRSKHCSSHDDAEELVSDNLFQNMSFVNRSDDSSYHDFDDVSYQMFLSQDMSHGSARNFSPSSVDSDFVSHRSSDISHSSSASHTTSSSSQSSQ